MLASMSPRASCTQRDPKMIKLMRFEEARVSLPEVTIPLIGALTAPIAITTVNDPDRILQ